MSKHTAQVAWTLNNGDFLKGTYSREHLWKFDGGVVVPASPALTSVPLPYSNPANVDPEEAYIAAISSCHLLSFLYVAFQGGFEVLSYNDNAIGDLTANERRVKWVSKVTLHPKIVYGTHAPTPEQEAKLHHEAHETCYIANSVKTEIIIA